jgi:hypothetical protein
LVGGEVTAVFPARVKVGSLRHLPARVLPNLPCVVPMETKLRENGGNLRGLLSLKLNPNPFANYFGNIPKSGASFRIRSSKDSIGNARF